jgi:hypothetical protein
MNQEQFIWTDSAAAGRSRVALFRRTFSLKSEVQNAFLHLFADTRYRLMVNGITVGHGPGRFHITHPQYDSWDIAPYLLQGDNVIAVIVHSMGRGTFSSDASRGGLIAWGEIGDAENKISLATNASWKALECQAYAQDTARLSFALGPYELLDARLLPMGWETASFDDQNWHPAVPLTEPHWGKLKPRSIPLLDEREVLPEKVLNTFQTRHDENQKVCSLRYAYDGDEDLWPTPVSPSSLALLTFLHSPKQQRVKLGVSWGYVWLNGQQVKPQGRRDLAWRSDCEVTLEAGWNSWLVLDNTYGDAFEYVMQWPLGSELTLNVEQQLQSEPSFLVAGPWAQNVQSLFEDLGGIAEPSQLPEQLGKWSSIPAHWGHSSPFGERAWESVEPVHEKDANVYLFDFGTEVLGRPLLEFTAPAGTIVDLLYTEQLQNGAARHGIQATRMGERYLAREGHQSWHVLHPRGTRYLEVVVRGDQENFRLHKLSLARANYPVRDVGSFTCSDPLLNRIWQVGRDTLFACMEDAYLDCPWRERGMYTGDLLVQFYVNGATFGDYALMRRGIELLWETQSPESGLLSCASHGLLPGRHPDYSMIAVQCLWHYWARSGDIEFVRQCESGLRNLLDALQKAETPGLNLFDFTGTEPYIDLSHFDREGINCAGNCFHYQAFVEGAKLLRVLGDENEALRYEKHAGEIFEAIQRAFWSKEQKLFLDRRLSDNSSTQPSALGNVLALLYGLELPSQKPFVLAFVLDSMKHNRRVPEPKQNSDFNITSYSSFYALGALLQNGKANETQDFMRDNWGRLLDAGAVTWWEYFLDEWSLCHAWSASPTHYLSTQVLGVQYATPGQPDEIIIAPQPGDLQWAEGTYPHPRGPIHVSWQKRGDQLKIDYELPEGVKLIRE